MALWQEYMKILPFSDWLQIMQMDSLPIIRQQGSDKHRYASGQVGQLMCNKCVNNAGVIVNHFPHLSGTVLCEKTQWHVYRFLHSRITQITLKAESSQMRQHQRRKIKQNKEDGKTESPPGITDNFIT